MGAELTKRGWRAVTLHYRRIQDCAWVLRDDELWCIDRRTHRLPEAPDELSLA